MREEATFSRAGYLGLAPTVSFPLSLGRIPRRSRNLCLSDSPEGVNYPGRAGKIREVEIRITREALRGADCRSLLEVGTGPGRLTPVLRALATKFVGIDLDSAVLRLARRTVSGDPGPSFCTADVHRLPFRDASFTVVVMIRLYHRLREAPDPLAEVFRILSPGGHLLLASNPRPSLLTLYFDIWARLRQRERYDALTFTRKPVVVVQWGNTPGQVATKEVTETRLRNAGFSVRARFQTGLEELPLLRAAPVGFLGRVSHLRTHLPIFPTLFTLAEKSRNDRFPGGQLPGGSAPRTGEFGR